MALLNQAAKRGKLLVVFGRRRVGKTALLEQWAKSRRCGYSQIVEGTPRLQIAQIVDDLGSLWPDGIMATDLASLLAALSLIRVPTTIVLDEFPYLVAANSSVPSIFQKWVDHKQPKNLHLVLLGSSQTMMHSLFLDAAAPLYERAQLLLHLTPMNYRHFCEAIGVNGKNEEDFIKYSLVGGIPQYWTYCEPGDSALDWAEQLFFGKSARLQAEPDSILRDEHVEGLAAKAILEAIGRGAAKPSEIAARLGVAQTNLGRPLQILLNASMIERQLPFGESVRTTKRVLYRVSDVAMRFWYNVYSPHRSRWHLYGKDQRLQLLRDHAASVLESSYRSLFPDSTRYWEGDRVEFDSVRFLDGGGKAVIVSEIKWRQLSAAGRESIRQSVTAKFNISILARRYKLSKVEALDFTDVTRALIQATHL